MAIGAVATGGAGLYGTRAVQATIAEADLSRIGKGTRSVVQIHDPQCQLCTTLQRQTRRALKAYSEDEVTYLVANIKTREGAAFAGRFGVPHVTLLFFDETGTHADRLAAQVRQAAPNASNKGRDTGSPAAFHSGCHCTDAVKPGASLT